MLFTTLQIINTLIFIGIAGIHLYWAFGGKFGVHAVIPEVEGKLAFEPPFLATIMVVVAMLGAAWLSWFANSNWLFIYGNLSIGIIFLMRAIGDFKYVGFSKKVKNTLFAKNDTIYYSPLCLLISFIAFFIYWAIK